MTINSRISGFKNMSVQERRNLIADACDLDPTLLNVYTPGEGLSISQSDHMIENVIGSIGIPVGIAANFTIDGADYFIPMATEEPSVVAAASNAARIARVSGGFQTSASEPIMQAQIQLVDVSDPEAARIRLLDAKSEIIARANAVDPMLVKVGGGVREISVRVVQTRTGAHVVLHLHVDVRDAMGANAVNTMAESIADFVGGIGEGTPILRILTNKADLRLVRARAVFNADLVGGKDGVKKIIHAAALAEADPYRAATHNKGIMNGISAVVLATGNDTRAVESGCHSHAVNSLGRYTSLSHYEENASGNIVGTLELPMPVGLVGGATKVHPVAQANLKILGVDTAEQLGRIIVAVGLAQNFAGLRVLASEGVQRGHMSLHARNVAITAGAKDSEIEQVVDRLVSDRVVRVEHAEVVLSELRGLRNAQMA